MLTKKEIQKIHQIKKLKEKAQEINIAYLPQEEKEQILSWLNVRMEEIRKQKKKARQKEKNEKHNFNIYFTEAELEILQKSQDTAKKYSNEEYSLKDIIKLKSLSKDTLKEDEIKANQQRKNKEEAKQNLIKETLTTINRIGTNINQIARDFNERRLFSNNNNLRREEKERMLEVTEKLEETLINLINNSENYDN